ncbi:DNA-directed RNA polymerases IV and V subunit 2 [Cryptomeria japonica]|uniref:DNA-directed RNA polymerases IV and V subunit 2 n=1 Tax=Cryptomeria japonica TaxID=3369 RepID=UPI0027DA6ADF|nr:DNA-directed RNA polymerases IV and V subunit 2 [Cryptomeria japonica]
MSSAGEAEGSKRNVHETNYQIETEVEAKRMDVDVVDISDESDDCTARNDGVQILSEEMEDTATQMDMTNITEAGAIEKDVLYRAENANGHEIEEDVLYREENTDPDNWDLGDILKEIEKCGKSMDIDIAEQVQELGSNIDVASVAEETDSSEEEQDISNEFESELSDKDLRTFCRDSSKAFFDEWGLISHQLNSFNHFMSHGLQKVFDDLGMFDVEPDNTKKRSSSDTLRYWASVTFGKVTVEKPSYSTREGKRLALKPAEARLRNMTYSSPIYVEITTKVYIQEGMKTNDKSKSSSSSVMNDAKNLTVVSEERKRVFVGQIPIMVKSHLCYLSSLTCKELLEEGVCSFEVGGYFIINGTEKVFIAQEERCTNRIWVSNTPSWMAIYTPYTTGFSTYKKKVFVKIIKTSKDDKWCGGRQVITVNFLSITVPVVIMFYALGVKSDLEMMQMIGNASNDYDMRELLLSSIYKAEAEIRRFRRKNKAWDYFNERFEKCKLLKVKDAEEALKEYFFPYIVGYKQKAMFLGYMVNCLISSYFGQRHVENKDEYKNKRVELAGELLGREVQGLVRHFRNRFSKGIQRELSVHGNINSMEIYADGSIITNGLVRAFSTGNWCHPNKFHTKCTGIVASLKSTNPLQTMSEMRRLRLRVQYAAKLGDARYPGGKLPLTESWNQKASNNMRFLSPYY